ncbi:M3 family metallopeptidase [Roseimicrobium sp. ORNL1]|uniref:M3 family metallopeptidase n=1 Tax=Roseimicrobium sp. ORNL1 TaxID=2711231 RepID=UPI0013E11F7A|nr:M3 family metallopeptidase [Roseimicrobium sp. ORNL1]QIF00201.1 M3 family metallopeptidase [Roseimicrobium sp. ORNL1]
MSHPYLDESFHVRWSTLAPATVEADITLALERAEQKLADVVNQDRGRLSFESVIMGYEDALRELNESWGLVTHLDSVCNGPELREAHNKMLPKVSAFFAKIPLDEHLWDLILTYSKTDEAKALTGTQRRAVDELLAWFRQHGAELLPAKKKRLEEIEAELSQATQKYSENVLDSTNAWDMVIDDVAQLKGLPQSAIDAAKADAAAKGVGTPEAPKYRFTLKAPSLIPVMEHAEDDSLRKRVWEGNGTVGRGDKYDNTALVWQILRLRHEKATLLGKPQFADYILERRMAKNGRTALTFTEDLHRKVKSAFDREIVDLQEYRADKTHTDVRLLEPWEVAYWSEKRRHERYDFDHEELRPYFPVDGVLSGMFRIAEKLFDVRIAERQTTFSAVGDGSEAPAVPAESGAVEVWHPEVKFFDMRNADGVLIGGFYADWHPRDSKRSGAWMNYLKGGWPPNGERDRRAHLGLICGNMTPPVDGKPALLTHDEVCTIFHEFGHLIHQLFGNVPVPSLNGVNVAWDFVELPSQLMENFCWERESLDFFAKHHETGAPIPDDLFKKLINARNYMSAVAMMRQLSFGKLDLELHINHSVDENADLDRLGRTLLKDYIFPTNTEPPSMARRFGHLFSSPVGYAASYYSYKWAEVLDADAFTRFQHEGVLNPKVGRALRDNILSKGNSEDPAKLFRDFMGRDPDPNALLARAGLA